jgi:magnesium-transporting ATPase (P-type)
VENYRRPNGRGAEGAGGESRAAAGGNRIAQQNPFDSQYKYMSTLYRIGNEEMILITGAPDVLFRCVSISRPRTACSR